MEITKKARFIQDFYGGKGYLTGDEIVARWLISQQDRLLNPRHKALKDAVGNEKKLEEILGVLNTDKDGCPIVGNWMLYRCSLNAQKLAGTWNKYKVSADLWKDSIKFKPTHINLFNGNKITGPEGVETYSVTTRIDGKPRSFFKSYQYVKAGAEFEFTIHFPDDLCEKVEGKGKDKIFVPDLEKTEKCVNAILDKMKIRGLGAFPERFGEFEYI